VRTPRAINDNGLMVRENDCSKHELEDKFKEKKEFYVVSILFAQTRIIAVKSAKSLKL